MNRGRASDALLIAILLTISGLSELGERDGGGWMGYASLLISALWLAIAAVRADRWWRWG
jgi:hypothetical protein